MAQAPHRLYGARSGAVADPPVPRGVDPSARARPASTTTTSAARTTSRPTGTPRSGSGSACRSCPTRRGRTAASTSERRPGWRPIGHPPVHRHRAGLPTQGNTHEEVRRAMPDARVVYVDHDPMVLAHAHQLLGESTLDQVRGCRPARSRRRARPSRAARADRLHRAGRAADDRGAAFRGRQRRPVGAGQALRDRAGARKLPGVVPRHRGQAAAAGHPGDGQRRTGTPPRNSCCVRGPEVARFFAGLDLVSPYAGAAPGISFVGQWGAVDPDCADSDGSRVLYCGVARCP